MCIETTAPDNGLQSVICLRDGPDDAVWHAEKTELSPSSYIRTATVGPHEYCVVLAQGSCLGLKMHVTVSQRLTVLSVGHGLVEDWNEEHPESRVEPGDCLVEVDGVRDVPADLLLQRIHTKGALTLVFDSSMRSSFGRLMKVMNATIS